MINKIKIIRTNEKISQEVLAQKVGVSRITINSIENGRSTPKINVAMKIAEALGKKVEDIFFNSTVNHELQEPEKIA